MTTKHITKPRSVAAFYNTQSAHHIPKPGTRYPLPNATQGKLVEVALSTYWVDKSEAAEDFLIFVLHELPFLPAVVAPAVEKMLLDTLNSLQKLEHRILRERSELEALVRHSRRATGIAKAAKEGTYKKGRGVDKQKHANIMALVGKGTSVRGTARLLNVSTSTVMRAIKNAKAAG